MRTCVYGTRWARIIIFERAVRTRSHPRVQNRSARASGAATVVSRGLVATMPWVDGFAPVIVLLFALSCVHMAVALGLFIKWRSLYPLNARKLGLVTTGVVRAMAMLYLK